MTTDHAIDFKDLIAEKQNEYFPGTRHWVFDAVSRWLASDKRLFWLVGPAGTGKSVVSAMLFGTPGIKEHIVAWHFCKYDNAPQSEVELILKSWCIMFARNLPGFQDAPLEEKSESHQTNSASYVDLFESLIGARLRALPPTATPVVIVLDALDEMPDSTLVLFLSLLTEIVQSLPPFVRFFVTSRGEAQIKKSLLKFDPVELSVDDIRNRADLRKYLADVARKQISLKFNISDMEIQLEKQFELKSGSLHSLLLPLEDPICRSVDAYDVVVQRLQQDPAWEELCAIRDIEPNPSPAMQQEANLDLLYGDAELAREHLLSLFSTEWLVAETIGDTVLRVPVAGKAAPWVDNAIDPGLKSKESTRRKIELDCGGDARRMKDLARITAECKSCSRMSQALKHLQSLADLEIIALRNKYVNPTPLGYRDFNLSVRLTLPNGGTHICEVQVNQHDMLTAKATAHVHYEMVRVALPGICHSAGIPDSGRGKFEAAVMKLLRTPVLYAAIRELELKADGLFLYASLLSRELQLQPGLIQFSQLQALPSGLGEIYKVNFDRITGQQQAKWELLSRVIAMIIVARAPLPKLFVEQVFGGVSDQVIEALSILFPVRGSSFQMMHKSMAEWLLNPSSPYTLSQGDCMAAHKQLAEVLRHHSLHSLDDPHSASNSFALRHSIFHLCAAGMVHEAADLLLDFRWLLARATAEASTLVADALRVEKGDHQRSTKLVCSALKLASEAVCQNWQYLPGQLIGRLMAYETKHATIAKFLEQARAWPGPEDGRGWWCPVEPTLTPAGGKSLAAHQHSSSVCTLRWSHDDELLCGGCGDGTIAVWLGNGARRIRTLSGHKKKVTSVAWNGQGKLCSGSEDRTVMIWDVHNGEIEHAYPMSYQINSVCWIDEARIVSGGGSIGRLHGGEEKMFGTVAILSVVSGSSPITMTGHTEQVTSVDFCAQRGLIASASDDGTARIWNLNGECVNTLDHGGLSLRGGPVEVRALAWSYDGRLCTCSSNSAVGVRIWDVTSCMSKQINSDRDPLMVYNSVCWRDDKKVCSGDWNGRVCVWDVESVKLIFGGSHIPLTNVHTVTWNKDGRICSGGSDCMMRLWDFEHEAEEIEIVCPPGTTTSVIDLCWTVKGNLWAFFSQPREQYGANCVVLVNLDNNKFDYDDATYHLAHTMSLSRDGRICVSFRNVISVYDVANTRTSLASFSQDDYDVLCLQWSSDGKIFVAGGFKNGGSAKISVWHEKKRNQFCCSFSRNQLIRIARWSNDGSKLAVYAERIDILDAKDKYQCALSLDCAEMNFLCWSNDDKLLCGAGDDQIVELWSVSSGELLHRLRGHSNSVWRLSFNASATRICSTSINHELRLWDVKSGECIFQGRGLRHGWEAQWLEEEPGLMYQPLGFSPDMVYVPIPQQFERAIAETSQSGTLHPVKLRGAQHSFKQPFASHSAVTQTEPPRKQTAKKAEVCRVA